MVLSHTQKEAYVRCPYAYFMHYMLGYREAVVGSALPLGNSMDIGLNALIETRKLDVAKKAFQDSWLSQKINGKLELLFSSSAVRYSKADLDESLLTEREMNSIAQIPSWISLGKKGEMFLEAYAEQVLPKIKKVLEIQQTYIIKNNVGDEIICKPDLICEWEDDRLLILDNKTSSVKYDMSDLTENGSQLALYEEAVADKYSPDACGYVVIPKNIRKKKLPRVEIQTIIDKLPEELKEKTLDEFDKVLHNIKMGKFPSNHPHCNTFYGKCICQDFIESDFTNTNGLVTVGRYSNG